MPRTLRLARRHSEIFPSESSADRIGLTVRPSFVDKQRTELAFEITALFVIDAFRLPTTFNVK